MFLNAATVAEDDEEGQSRLSYTYYRALKKKTLCHAEMTKCDRESAIATYASK